LRDPDKQNLFVWADAVQQVVSMHRIGMQSEVFIVFNFNLTEPVRCEVKMPEGVWQKQFDASDHRWQTGNANPILAPEGLLGSSTGNFTLAPKSFAVYVKEQSLDDAKS